MSSPPHEITQLLVAWSDGDQSALDHLVPLVEAELRRLARNYLRKERAGHSLQTLDLIQEAYLRLIDWNTVRWRNRTHFYGMAAKLMRNILVDHARRRQYLKHGGDAIRVSLTEADKAGQNIQVDVVALDDALKSLAAVDERKSRIVELRFFGGLSVEEVAEVLKISQRTVFLDWEFARTWLYRELSKR